MSNHDRKNRSQSLSFQLARKQSDKKADIRPFPRSPIATPPRVALQGRSSTRENPPAAENTTSSASSPDSLHPTVPSDALPASSASSTFNDAASIISASTIISSKSVDKDDRIAYLEKEMAILEGELSAELDRLSQKLVAETEAGFALQDERNALAQQCARLESQIQIMRHEAAGREERERDSKTRISSLMIDRDMFREGFRQAKSEAKERDEDVQALKTQVKALKDFVSAGLRSEGQVTDEVFAEELSRLGSGLQNWVIQNFRRAKINVRAAKEATKDQLLVLVPTYESLASTAKLHLIQSIISRLLVMHIFDKCFIGLSAAKEAELNNFESYLASISRDSTDVNQWRSTTLSIIMRSSSDQDKYIDEAAGTVIEKMNNIMSGITDISATQSRDQSLRVLVNSCIELARKLRVQKAKFRTIMPVIEGHQINLFDAQTMEDVGGEDEDTLQGREILCATFPGILKEGDESGQRLQLRNVIVRAKVLCSE